MHDRRRNGWKFWVVLGLGLGLFITLVQSILLPFVVGILAAYFLDPAADRLERAGCTRTTATSIITVVFFSLLILGCVTLIPMLAHQITDLMADLPGYFVELEKQYRPVIERYLGQFAPKHMDSVRQAIDRASASMLGMAGDVGTRIFYSGVALLNLLSLFLITPVVVFYLLRDWDNMVRHLDRLLPLKQADIIRAQIRAIDATLAGFLRGQLNVCLLLALFYAVGLSLTGLQFGMAIGIVTGLLVIFPYVGFLLGLATGLGIAFVQFTSYVDIGLVAAVFALGCALEGGVITPKLVGEKVGLHPLWIIFGMLSGAALFGLVGVLLAVPVTAIIGVLMRFWIERYRLSPLYHGIDAPGK